MAVANPSTPAGFTARRLVRGEEVIPAARATWQPASPRRASAAQRFARYRRLWTALTVAAALATPFLLFGCATLFLTAAARSFRIDDAFGDWVQGLAWAGGGLAAIGIAPLPGAHKRPLLLLWTVHVGIALGIMLLYESHYGLDAAVYFKTGINEPNPLENLVFGQGTQNVSALVGLISDFVGQSYHALKVVWAFVGLMAVYVFYLAARIYLGRDDIRVLYVLGLFPSIAFWSSILGKDPITLLGLALFTLGVVGVLRRRGSKYLLILAVGLAIASAIRIWLGAIFLAPFVATMIVASKGGPLRKVMLLACTLPAFLIALQAFGDKFSIESADDLVAVTDDISQNWAHGGSGEKIEGGFQSIGSMITFMPIGVVTALFRPVPGEVLSPFGIFASLENAVVIFLLFGALRRHPLRRLRDPVLLWTAMTVFTWATVYGFVSYQNLGSAFRFKLQVMPLLVLLILAMRTPLPQLAQPRAWRVPGANWRRALDFRTQPSPAAGAE